MQDLILFITYFRTHSKDPIIIYTGYKEEELIEQIKFLQQFDDIIVKYGRFIPNSPHIYDTTLGVELASNNQYAKSIIRSVKNEYSIANSGENTI